MKTDATDIVIENVIRDLQLWIAETYDIPPFGADMDDALRDVATQIVEALANRNEEKE